MEEYMVSGKLDRFADAFTHASGCVRFCSCGKIFYHPSNDWDWEEGELEALDKNENATRLPHAAGSFELEGREYVCDCKCWHEKAKRVISFLDHYSHEIATYLNREKQHAQRVAESMPTVDD